MQIAEQREFTGRGDDLEGVGHRRCRLADAVVPERLAFLLARAGQGQAYRLTALLDGNEVGRDDAGCRQRNKIDDLKTAGDDAWERVTTAVEKSWGDIKAAFDKAQDG